MPYTETYASDRVQAFPGMVADTSPATIVSREAGADIAFGKAVVIDGATVRAFATGDTAIDGISVRSQAIEAEADQYTSGVTAAVLKTGAMFVLAGEAVAFGDPVYVEGATGDFVKTPTENVAIPNARFEQSAADGGLTIIRIT